MKTTIQFLSILSFSLMVMACNGQSNSKAQSEVKAISKIEVLDFHSKHRCMTCNAIEANTKYTLETYFSDELKTEKITFHVINVDEEENEQIAEKFEAASTALYLNVIKNGKETKNKFNRICFYEWKRSRSFHERIES